LWGQGFPFIKQKNNAMETRKLSPEVNEEELQKMMQQGIVAKQIFEKRQPEQEEETQFQKTLSLL